MRVITKEDGQRWCYMASEMVIHKKGWTEGTKGAGSQRAIENDTFEAMCRQLKGCEWECHVSSSQVKKIDSTGDLPEKVSTKMQLCYKAVI